MKIKTLLLALTVTTLSFPALAVTAKKSAAEINYVRQELQQIIDINLKYQERFHDLVSQEMLKKQTPDATIVLCSDSRVDTNSINETPAGQLFSIRNIGNQVQTAYGSVEYGVNHLHTPMLIVVGHSECGAVKAAMTDFSKESLNIKRELETLDVNPKATLNQNIVHNVNNQVKLAVADFEDQVNSGNLLVIGMVYDIHNDFKFGSGKIILVNINNETDPHALAQNPYVKGLQHIAIYK
ncbi:MAG TPA: carbonic anhydrase [Gammaproteobacteria bacterium]|nr:carbonic anhydrase [Gammaproteobacteria bacterium]